MESLASSLATGVFLPNYPLASGDLLRAIEHSGSVAPTSTDDAGEYYAMAMAQVLQADQVPVDSIMVVPLTPPRADEVLDFSFVAASECMYVQLHEQPQFRRTYGHCMAYSGDLVEKPLEIGAVFKFATIGTFIIAKRQLVAAVRATTSPAIEDQSVSNTDKRQCVRPLVVWCWSRWRLGRRTEDEREKPEGVVCWCCSCLVIIIR
jgi:hypothetical protein